MVVDHAAITMLTACAFHLRFAVAQSMEFLSFVILAPNKLIRPNQSASADGGMTLSLQSASQWPAAAELER